MKKQLMIAMVACAMSANGQNAFIGKPAIQADDPEELAKKLANPVAALISVPLQYNYDTDYGVNDNGTRQFINVQPVIPISISEDWNVISRTIIPLISQSDMPSGTDKSGLGDVLQSLFVSPKAPTKHGLIWGAGPAINMPTATDDVLGGQKWAAGPTAVMLKQQGPWTVGLLVNHLWSFAGEAEREDINATFMQPFVACLTKTKTTFSLNTESSYNWTDSQWTVPLNFQIQQVLKIGKQPVAFQIGYRYYADKPDGGPDWGLRFAVTFLFPKH